MLNDEHRLFLSVSTYLENVPAVHHTDHPIQYQVTHLFIRPKALRDWPYPISLVGLDRDISSPGSATPVSSTMTQSTPFWEATISSMAAIPMSLKEQQRHPFGSDSRAVVWELESGSDSVNDLATRSAQSRPCDSSAKYLRCRSYRQSLLDQHWTDVSTVDSPFMQTAILYPWSAVRTYLQSSQLGHRRQGTKRTLTMSISPLLNIRSRGLLGSLVFRAALMVQLQARRPQEDWQVR